MSEKANDTVILLFIAVSFMLIAYLRRRKAVSNEFGSASFATDALLKSWGMFRHQAGLVLGRTLSGHLIWVWDYCHVLLAGGTGSGKGVGIIIPNLLAYHRGSVVVFDAKGDLYQQTGRHRAQGGRTVIRLAPFGGGDCFNPLDTVSSGELMIDDAKALAEALVVRPPAGAHEPHWDDKSAQVITALVVFVLMMLEGKERSLNSVQDLASDPVKLHKVGSLLKRMGRIQARMGSQILALFDKDMLLTKEGSGVMSSVSRHLSFLDSEAIALSVEGSNWNPEWLLEPGTTLYIQLPPHLADACRGWLRCVISTLGRLIGSTGSEVQGETLFVLDECSLLGGLPAIEEALVRGRSSGIRMILVYQSDSQVQAAFPGKPGLIYDNTATQIYLGANSIETAERLSKALGSWTQCITTHGSNWSQSHSTGGHSSSGSANSGGSISHAPQARPLLYPDEILRMGDEYLIAFQRGLPSPILARKIRWFADHVFNRRAKRPRPKPAASWLTFAAVVGGLVLVLVAAQLSHRENRPPPRSDWLFPPEEQRAKQTGRIPTTESPTPRATQPKRR